jgi:PAS domain S-box-containing protein
LFFAAVLATSLYAGVGPGLVATLVSMPLAAYMLVVRAGYHVSQAAFQSALFVLDGGVVVYLTYLMKKGRDALTEANRQLRQANEEIGESEARTRELIEVAPDAFFQSDLEARFTDMNEAACRLLGYTRDELLRKTIFEIIPAEDAPRLKGVRNELLVPGMVSRAEWMLQRKDGTLVPVEVSAKILPAGRWQAFIRDISERRRIEDEREVFVSFLENSPDFIGIADPHGKPVYVNPAGRRMVGLPPEFPVANTQIAEYYPPDQRAFATDVIVRSMIEQGRWHGETYFRHWQTQEAIPVSDEHFVIRHSKSGRLLGMGTITRDISEARQVAAEREQLLAREQIARRQAETANEQLRESEERFRLTIDEAPIGMALMALDGRFVRVNRALCEIMGYDNDELTKLTFQTITHSDDLDADVTLARRLAQGEIPRYQLEKRYIRKDGSAVEIMLSASILRGPDGTPLYCIAQIEDITERKRAEHALRLSEAKFAGIVSIAAEAIISVDQNERIAIFNEGAERIFGYSKAEALGQKLDILIPERFRELHRQHFAEFGSSQENSRNMGERMEVFGRRKDGEEFPAEASISKVTAGDVTFFSVVLRDITLRKSTEQALRRAIVSREQVLGIVAHDLRNPLSNIMQCLALESARAENEGVNQRRMQIISRAATRMNHLIQDLLDVSLLEAGRLAIERERLPVADLLREAVEMQLPLASSAGLDIRLNVEGDIEDVYGSRHRLLQVLENLVGNAIKFTPTGGHVQVGAFRKGEDVLFYVADDGAGIAPQELDRVFDRFWQATTKARRLGAGLGLPITKGIVEAHGGRIWVESKLGTGTTFFFTIPSVDVANQWSKLSA